jgi:DNA-binding response OmpR family regulator
MKKPRVLIVDDDPLIRKFVGANLKARNHEVLEAENGAQAMDVLHGNKIDLVILDIMMPKLDGYEVCRRMRRQSAVPIMMLSAKDDQSDKLRCLELGADDYMTKPFSLSELLGRVDAIFRRTRDVPQEARSTQFVSGDMEIDYNRRRVYLRGFDVKLTKTEYEILAYLATNAGRIISPQFILEKIWGEDNIENSRRLWVNISRLRKKMHNISPDADYLQTRSGMGYFVSGSPR